MQKQNLRTKLIKKRAVLSEDQVQTASKIVSKKLQSLPKLQTISHLAAYMPFHNEISPLPFISEKLKQGINIYFPRFNQTSKTYELVQITNLDLDFEPGKYGILEPKKELQALENPTIIQGWLIPGIAFDKTGNRLGWGKGYFDRLLEKSTSLKIGLCYTWQIVPKIKKEAHDIGVDMIMSE